MAQPVPETQGTQITGDHPFLPSAFQSFSHTLEVPCIWSDLIVLGQVEDAPHHHSTHILEGLHLTLLSLPMGFLCQMVPGCAQGSALSLLLHGMPSKTWPVPRASGCENFPSQMLATVDRRRRKRKCDFISPVF